jgi:hypothetical protein
MISVLLQANTPSAMLNAMTVANPSMILLPIFQSFIANVLLLASVLAPSVFFVSGREKDPPRQGNKVEQRA